MKAAEVRDMMDVGLSGGSGSSDESLGENEAHEKRAGCGDEDDDNNNKNNNDWGLRHGILPNSNLQMIF